MIPLSRRSQVSWATEPRCVPAVARLLKAQGFHEIEAKQHEAYRLVHRCGCVTILYASGSIVTQGNTRAVARATRYFERLQRALDRQQQEAKQAPWSEIVA